MSGPILVFDIETDGRLWELTRVHCVVTQDLSTGEIRRFRRNDSENSIGEAWDHLCTASRLVAHNGVMFDAPALARALGRNLEDLPRVIDTLILSRLYWPDSKNHPLSKLHNMPNSLAAWGRYLGDHKSDSPDSWDRWTPYMEDYCEQDVRVTAKVYRWLASRMFKDWREAVSVEHSVAEIIRAQHLNGFCFDQAAAMRLVATLTAEKATVMDELQDLFPPEIEQMKTPEYWEYAGLRAPTKRELANLLADREIPKNRVRDAEPGPPRTREIPFNPGSTPHIVRRLGEKYGWKPTVFTENGNPKMDEKIIKKIPYPEARLIERILLLDKRLSQVDNWFTNLKDDGKIHGEVNTIGAVTSRMTHSSPNVSQVPRVSSPFGPECRRCWTARPGWWLVGADASGLELRMLAHELARWDGGEYAKIVT